MTAVVEMGTVATVACTAASTLSLAAYSHCAKAHLRVDHNASLPPRKEHEGPLRKDDVAVTINGKSKGRRSVEFSGEVLCIALEDERLTPLLALGGADLKVEGSQVTLTSPVLPTVELTFSRQAEASMWANEFREAEMLGPPQERILELIDHSVQVEKHIQDLIGRAQNAQILEKQNKKLRKYLGLPEVEGPQVGEPSGLKRFLTTAFSNERDGMSDLRMQVQEEKMQTQKAQALAENLKKQMDEHVPPEVHQSVHEEMQWHLRESRRALEEVLHLRRRHDELQETKVKGDSACVPPQLPSYDTPRDLSTPRGLVMESFKEAQQQLAATKQRVQQERERADALSAQVQTLSEAKAALLAKISKLKAAKTDNVTTPRKNGVEDRQLQQQEEHRQLCKDTMEQALAVEELVIANHEKMQAQRLDFARQLEEQRRQQLSEICELQQMHEAAFPDSADSSLKTSMTCNTVEDIPPSVQRLVSRQTLPVRPRGASALVTRQTSSGYPVAPAPLPSRRISVPLRLSSPSSGRSPAVPSTNGSPSLSQYATVSGSPSLSQYATVGEAKVLRGGLNRQSASAEASPVIAKQPASIKGSLPPRAMVAGTVSIRPGSMKVAPAQMVTAAQL